MTIYFNYYIKLNVYNNIHLKKYQTMDLDLRKRGYEGIV